MLRNFALVAILLLAACKPPASDEYIARGETGDERKAPSEPIGSPDTEGAEWAESATSGKLLYGLPGSQPFFSLTCEDGIIAYTRYVAADPEAKAVLALIGNGHVERLWIDAQQQGESWLWQGRIAADDPRLEVLTGLRRVEATVPGAGSLILNPSRSPADYITRCAGRIPEPQALSEDQA